VIRTQISLSREQAEYLRRTARKRHTSMSALIREAVDEAMNRPEVDDEAWEKFLGAIGCFSGPDDACVSERHDEFVADAYEDWR
jgi:hypothetical protein